MASNPYEDKIAQFVEDEVMFNTVKSVLFAHFDANTLMDVPRFERDMAVQAVFDGRARLEDGFKELEKFKRRTELSTPAENPVV